MGALAGTSEGLDAGCERASFGAASVVDDEVAGAGEGFGAGEAVTGGDREGGGGAMADKVGGTTPWDVFGGARTLDLGLLKPIIGGTAPLTLMPRGGARIGAARTPEGFGSGGRARPDGGVMMDC